jgi:hypothetical protein
MHALVALLLVAFGSGWWVWQRAEAGIAQVETEVQAEVIAELWQGDKPSSQADVAAANLLDRLILPADTGEIITQVELRELGEDWAVVDVTLQPAADGPSYHQTRVYQEDVNGWQRTQASTARWGQPQQLESQNFIFVYHDLDEAAVKQAVHQIDALYPQLHRDLYGTSTAHEKLKITLSPTQSSGPIHQDGYPQVGIVLPSPAAALRPSDLSAGDMLLQSLVLAIFDRQTIDSFPTRIRYGQWFQLYNAYRLWFIWEHDLPLAQWRAPLVQWIFEKPGDARDPYAVPAFARDLCAHHKLWQISPNDVAVPVHCWQRRYGTE